MTDRNRLFAILLPVVLCTPAAVFAGQGTPLPYRVYVEVVYGSPAGPESVREEMEAAVIDKLARAGCFRSIARAYPDPPSPDDLHLQLSIHDYEDETEFDLSIAARADPAAGPDVDRLQVARATASFFAELRTLGDSLPLRAKRFTRSASWRPLGFEDPREEARKQLIDEAAAYTRAFLCKGSPKKWVNRIASARAAAAGE